MGQVPSTDAVGLTELDHALQCAYELSLIRPDDVALQLAGLVHDVGHQLADDAGHARAGAAWVRPLLGERVAGLVHAHVAAKRYLVATEPGYVLSTVSTATLVAQGGPMRTAERDAFERSALFHDAVALRRADDAAKVPGRAVPDLDVWLPLVDAASR